MPYSTQDDLSKKVGGDKILAGLTTDDASNDNDINADVIAAAILEADTMIDSYVGQVYTVPLSTTPANINQASSILAAYYLMQRRFAEMDIPKGWKDRYDGAMKVLRMIADESLPLNVSTIAVESSEIQRGDHGGEPFDFTNPQTEDGQPNKLIWY